MKLSLKISKTFLVLESLPLLWVTIYGFMASYFTITEGITNQANAISSIVIGIMILIFLLSGWSIYLNVLFNGPQKGIYVPKILWGISIAASVISIALFFSDPHFRFINDNISLMGFGIFYIPTLIHLFIDTRIQLS